MMAAGRPPSLLVWVLSLVVFFVSGSGPCGKVGNAASSRFPLFHQGGSPFFFASFFFTNNPHSLRLFHRSGRSPLAPCAFLRGMSAVAVDGQLDDHRVVYHAIDGGGRGHGVLEDL